MKSCAALGCDVLTDYLFCFPHFRLLPEEERSELKHSGYSGVSVVKAIELIAEREGNEITLSQYTILMNQYVTSNTSEQDI